MILTLYFLKKTKTEYRLLRKPLFIMFFFNSKESYFGLFFNLFLKSLVSVVPLFISVTL